MLRKTVGLVYPLFCRQLLDTPINLLSFTLYVIFIFCNNFSYGVYHRKFFQKCLWKYHFVWRWAIFKNTQVFFKFSAFFCFWRRIYFEKFILKKKLREGELKGKDGEIEDSEISNEGSESVESIEILWHLKRDSFMKFFLNLESWSCYKFIFIS